MDCDTKHVTGILVLTVWLLAAGPSAVAGLDSDEEVIFFPASAHRDGTDAAWVVPLHGWVFEPEKDSLWRAVVLDWLSGELELPPGSARNRLFQERARWFLVDNERRERFDVVLGGESFSVGPSAENGHFINEIRLSGERPADGWLDFASLPAQGRRFHGRVRLLAPHGVSVISDIDDTIKDSRVRDKSELLANTFLREYRAVPGMAEVFRRWAGAGAAFHYVSASPWQLYPALSQFMARDGFPEGDFHLKSFRLKDETFFNLFIGSERMKPPVISAILTAYPQRKFVLVGDSGEKDPEVYGMLARRYPDQVIHVFIRRVAGAPEGARFGQAFAGIPDERWTVFADPRALLRFDITPREALVDRFRRSSR